MLGWSRGRGRRRFDGFLSGWEGGGGSLCFGRRWEVENWVVGLDLHCIAGRMGIYEIRCDKRIYMNV